MFEAAVGFGFGILFFMGLFMFKMMMWRARAFRHGGGHGRRWRRGRGRSRGWGQGGVEMLRRRLDLDEDQADLSEHAIADARRSVRELFGSVKDSRGELAALLREDTLDDGRLEVVFDRLREDLERARREVVSAVKQVHSTLDTDQRERAASWLAGSSRWI